MWSVFAFVQESSIVGLGKYSYRIYNRSMNPEEKKEYDEDPMFIPYTDRVVFEYGGGAAGPQSFGEDIKEEFMKKHQLLSDESNDN